MNKSCPRGKITNPKTQRCVSKNGVIGKQITEQKGFKTEERKNTKRKKDTKKTSKKEIPTNNIKQKKYPWYKTNLSQKQKEVYLNSHEFLLDVLKNTNFNLQYNIEYLTAGGQAQIFKVQDKRTKTFYALKVHVTEFVTLEDEMDNLLTCQNPKLVLNVHKKQVIWFQNDLKGKNENEFLFQLPEFVQNVNCSTLAAMLMTFYDNDLSRYLFNEAVNEKEASKLKLHVMRTTLQAVNFLHTKGILHMDIKPANFLYKGKTNIVISDLGMIEYFDPGTDKVTNTTRNQRCPMFGGTVQYWGYSRASKIASGGYCVSYRDDFQALAIVWYALFLEKILPWDDEKWNGDDTCPKKSLLLRYEMFATPPNRAVFKEQWEYELYRLGHYALHMKPTEMTIPTNF